MDIKLNSDELEMIVKWFDGCENQTSADAELAERLRGVASVAKLQDKVLKIAADALYFSDSKDYLPALINIVQTISPITLNDLNSGKYRIEER